MNTEGRTIDPRIEEERSFHNRRFEGGTDYVKEKTSPFYTVARRSFQNYRDSVFSIVGDGPVNVLEYGCGDGSLAFEIASKGADVVGIDISEAAVEKANKKMHGVSSAGGSLRFEAMNAEELGFPKASFDIVCGSAILHHLNLDKAYRQINHVLKPGGKAVFLEPLGYNPVINLYRRLTPDFRTPDEHPLLASDIRKASAYFETVQAEYLQLFTLMAVPFVGRSFCDRILSLLESAEISLFKAIPFLGLLAWSALLKFIKKSDR